MSYKVTLKVKELLEQRGITQKKLAEIAGIRESTISDIVRGSRTVINFEHLSKIAEAMNINDIRQLIDFENTQLEEGSDSTFLFAEFVDYCTKTKMSYSYKPVLIIAVLQNSDEHGNLTMASAVKFFKDYYEKRRNLGLLVEKEQCIYVRDDATDNQIAANIISNPVEVLSSTPFFSFDKNTQVLSMDNQLWMCLGIEEKNVIKKICEQRLENYFSNIE